mmetsp:Transcript_65270/g.141665  ORF Transcript_65270/g.141665 Transcript_65270/m.141665 type:complete len:134 (-) Transcript_65270:1662-2063(-)
MLSLSSVTYSLPARANSSDGEPNMYLSVLVPSMNDQTSSAIIRMTSSSVQRVNVSHSIDPRRFVEARGQLGLVVQIFKSCMSSSTLLLIFDRSRNQVNQRLDIIVEPFPIGRHRSNDTLFLIPKPDNIQGKGI